MKVVLSDVLTERAESVEPGVVDLDELITTGRRAVRNRRRAALAAVAASTALALGTTALVLGGDPDADVSPAPPVDTGVRRQLTYGLGQTVHIGDRAIDTDLDVLSIDVTDDGAVLTTFDGGIWFTDGSTVEPIGTGPGPEEVTSTSVTWSHGRPAEWVMTDSAGSLAAWLEYPSRHEFVLVFYDTDLRREVGRHSVTVSGRSSSLLASFFDGHAYVAVTAAPGGVDVVVSVDAFSREVNEMRPEVEYDEATRGRPRSLVLGSPDGRVLGGGRFIYTDPWDRLVVDGGRLTGGTQGLYLFDGATGKRVVLDVPDGYSRGSFYLVEWLDDDSFAMMHSHREPDNDLLVCRISAHRCDVVIDRGVGDGHPILPGDGGVGASYALGLVLQQMGSPPP